VCGAGWFQLVQLLVVYHRNKKILDSGQAYQLLYSHEEDNMVLMIILAAAVAAVSTPDSTQQDSVVQKPNGTTFIETTSKEMLYYTAGMVLKKVLPKDADADSILFWVSIESNGQGMREEYMLVFNADRTAVRMIGPLKRELAVVETIGEHKVVRSLREQSH